MRNPIHVITKFIAHIMHKRSNHWPTVRKHWLEIHPSCAACGGLDHTQVHHIQPFHLNPELELEPTNFIKTSGNKIKTVQLIRPSFAMDKLNSTKDYDKLLEIAIYNVDINICGVYYHSSFGVKESVEDSIFFIKNKAFLVNKEASMFQNTRIFGRVYKLEKKGYICLDANYSNMYLNNPFMKDIKYEKFKSDFYKKLERYKKLKYLVC